MGKGNCWTRQREAILAAAEVRAIDAVRNEYFRRLRIGITTVFDYKHLYALTRRREFAKLWEEFQRTRK